MNKIKEGTSYKHIGTILTKEQYDFITNLSLKEKRSRGQILRLLIDAKMEAQ